jgi:hypothetical protein
MAVSVRLKLLPPADFCKTEASPWVALAVLTARIPSIRGPLSQYPMTAPRRLRSVDVGTMRRILTKASLLPNAAIFTATRARWSASRGSPPVVPPLGRVTATGEPASPLGASRLTPIVPRRSMASPRQASALTAVTSGEPTRQSPTRRSARARFPAAGHHAAR